MYSFHNFCNIAVHCPLSQCPISRKLHIHIFCIRVFLFFINCFKSRVWSLWFSVYIWVVVCFHFTSCDVCLFLLLRDTGVCLRLFCTSLLWLWCQTSPHQPSHLGFGQTTIINKLHELLSSLQWLLLWWKASITADNNWMVTSMCWVGQSLMFTQFNDFVSTRGLLAASLKESLQVWSVVFHALWSLEHCVPFVFGADKLDYYSHSLRS